MFKKETVVKETKEKNLLIKELEEKYDKIKKLEERVKYLSETEIKQQKDISGLEKQVTELKLKVELNDFYKRIYPNLATVAIGKEGLLYVEKISTTSIPSENKMKVNLETMMNKEEYEIFVASKSEIVYLRFLPDVEEVKKLCP